MSDTLIPRSVLLVEDNEDDVFLMKRLFRKAAIDIPLHIVTDGRMAVDYLSGADAFHDRNTYPLPDLIFLDLKLPFLQGFEVLTWIRKQPDMDSIRVVVLSSSLEDQDRERANALSSPYLVKPTTSEVLTGILGLPGI
jgi:CheY-like chemotaxis protein